MIEMVRCLVCGSEREKVLTVPLACGHYTLEDTFGPFETLKVPSMDDEFGEDARFVRAARDVIARIEGVLRAHAEKSKGDYPELWQAQVEGVRADLSNPKWSPGQLTLKPLLRMLSPHKVLPNKSINLLPYGADEYKLCGDFRNAVMHENWDDLKRLGGPRRAFAWISSLEGLVTVCVNGGGVASAILALGNQQWPWPKW